MAGMSPRPCRRQHRRTADPPLVWRVPPQVFWISALLWVVLANSGPLRE
jgi:hypothetical protein